MIKPGNIFLLLVLGALMFIASCETERSPCLDASSNVVRTGAYHRADTGTAVLDSALRAPLFIALGALSDTNSIFVQLSGTNKFTFKLSDVSDTTRWIIRPDTAKTVQDTLTFIYQRQLHFINNACGYNYYYNLLKITSTRNAIDSVQLANPAVTSDASVEHIKIFY